MASQPVAGDYSAYSAAAYPQAYAAYPDPYAGYQLAAPAPQYAAASYAAPQYDFSAYQFPQYAAYPYGAPTAAQYAQVSAAAPGAQPGQTSTPVAPNAANSALQQSATAYQPAAYAQPLPYAASFYQVPQTYIAAPAYQNATAAPGGAPAGPAGFGARPTVQPKKKKGCC